MYSKQKLGEEGCMWLEPPALSGQDPETHPQADNRIESNSESSEHWYCYCAQPFKACTLVPSSLIHLCSSHSGHSMGSRPYAECRQFLTLAVVFLNTCGLEGLVDRRLVLDFVYVFKSDKFAALINTSSTLPSIHCFSAHPRDHWRSCLFACHLLFCWTHFVIVCIRSLSDSLSAEKIAAIKAMRLAKKRATIKSADDDLDRPAPPQQVAVIYFKPLR